MIERKAGKELGAIANSFKAVGIIGPRQSGKTTLARHFFKEKPYVSLENLDIRRFAQEDPRSFLAQYPGGAIIDEAQRAPDLFSYLQQVLDESRDKGKFILTGSNNFLLQENIMQSLAGRIGYLFLLPFSTEELQNASALPEDADAMMFKGCYPPVYDQEIAPERWYPNYIRTYVERDVRQIKNISNMAAFERFLKLCAGRIGQLLNVSNLGIEAGADHKTIAAWLSVLESSFIVHLLRPHYANFNKRIVKMPKLYFYDTGLACSLLGINQLPQLHLHPLRGSLFENFVIAELMKENYNQGKKNDLYFWRDNTGNEVDIIVERDNELYPVEVKAGATVTDSFFKGIEYWNRLTGKKGGSVVYTGATQKRSEGISVISWKEIGKI